MNERIENIYMRNMFLIRKLNDIVKSSVSEKGALIRAFQQLIWHSGGELYKNEFEQELLGDLAYDLDFFEYENLNELVTKKEIIDDMIRKTIAALIEKKEIL